MSEAIQKPRSRWQDGLAWMARVGRAVGIRARIALNSAHRAWLERAPIWRAIKPALSLAALAVATAVGLTIAPQGREILSVATTVDLNAPAPFALLIVSVVVFAVVLDAACVYVLSANRPVTRRRSAKPKGASSRTPDLSRFELDDEGLAPDVVHPSVGLRTDVALSVALIVPVSLLAWALEPLVGGWSGPIALGFAALVFQAQTALARNATRREVLRGRFFGLLAVTVWVVAAWLLPNADGADILGRFFSPAWVFGGLALLIALVHGGVSDHFIKSIGDASGALIVIDDGFRKTFDRFVGLLAGAVLVVIWWAAFSAPWVLSTLGPALIFLFSFAGIAFVIAHLVRRAIEYETTSEIRPVQGSRGRWASVLRGLASLIAKLAEPTFLLFLGVFLFVLATAFVEVRPSNAATIWDSPWRAFASAFGAALVAGVAVWIVAAVFDARPPVWLVIAPFLFMPQNDGHAIATVERDGGPERLDLNAHAERWLDAAVARAERGAPIPAIVVLAEGGGIRAAVQTNAMLHQLSCNDPSFATDVFALSGVSGGAVGLAAYLAERKDPSGCEMKPAAAVLAQDHFSALIAGLFAFDLPGALFPHQILFPKPEIWPDRADAFERSFQYAWSQAHSGAAAGGFDTPLEVLAAPADGGPAPIVLFSSVRVDTGELAVSSNARFGPCELERGKTIAVQDCLGEGETLSAITAAHLSARFPYSNPAAALDIRNAAEPRRIRLVDGAYLDNSGAAAASHAVRALKAAAEAAGVSERLRIVVVHLYARQIGERAEASGDAALAWLGAPLQAVVNARGARGGTVVSGFCQAAVSEAKPGARPPGGAVAADPDEICLTLTQARRAASRADASASDLSAAAFRPGAGLFWIHAPLDVAAPKSASDEAADIPLGWLIGEASRSEIERQACDLRDPILDLVGAARRIDARVEPGTGRPACGTPTD